MTTDFILARVDAGPSGAPGVLIYVPRRYAFAVTLERTYDAPPLPCCHRIGDQYVKIPPGLYTCRLDRYEKGRYAAYEIPVPGHDDIKLHKANTEAQLEGCPAVAESFAIFARPDLGLVGPGVADAKGGFEEFMRLAGGAPRIVLEVRDPAA